jgi:hypothetical protein
MRFLSSAAHIATALALLGALPLAAESVARPPRGPAASPEALAWQRYLAQSKSTLTQHDSASAAAALPPAPAGVTDLALSDFFAPIGDRGLEYSEKSRALSGQRVRLVGYMVREQERAPGLFRFAGWPIVVETQGLCVVDDTPPSVAYVIVPSSATAAPAWRPGRIVLTGTLELGARAEADGRNSFVRLILDAAPGS